MASRFASIIPRKAFGNHISLSDAYAWDRSRLFAFLSDVAKYPTDFGISKEGQADALKVIKLVQEFNYDSKLRVFTRPGPDKNSQPILNPQNFLWQGIPTRYYGIYDSLAYLVSLMGTAPLSATREDYYLPLLATYTKWCVSLAGNLERAPRRTFIAYNDRSFEQSQILISIDVPEEVESPPSDLDVALGATIGGAGAYKDAIQVNNWNWMKTQGKLDLGMNPNQSIIRQEPNELGQLFGHCAETIPLVVKLLTTDPLNINSVGGFCMSTKHVKKVDQYDAEKLCTHLKNPCANCLEVIKQFQADPKKFKGEAVNFFSGFPK